MADRDSGLEMSATPSACEVMMWDGWPTASAADEASTTTLSQLPELAVHHHSDMLSSFLSCDDQSNSGNGAFAFQPEPEATVSSSARNHVHHLGPMFQFQNLQSSKIMWPESPSSPLALHKWDHGLHYGPSIQLRHDAMADNSQRLDLFSSTDQRSLTHGTDQSRGFVNSDSVHSNFEPPPSHVWTSAPCTRSQQLTDFVRIAQEQRSVDSCSDPQGKSPELQSGKQHKQLLGLDHAESTGPPPKRPHLQPVDHGAALWHGHRSLYPPSTASPGIFSIGPALNTNGKPRARRGSATDPQSVYARHRREKINERLKTLQHLVPNGAKVDIVTMLDEAVHYVQFLQLQVKLLKSDEYWMHATPNSYKGIDLTCPVPHTETQGGLGSSV